MVYKGSARAGEAPSAAPRITAWSYSRLKTFQQCPFKLKCSAIDKLKEPESQAQLDGKRIHKEAEDYLNRKLIDVPEDLAKFRADAEALRDCGPDLQVEFPLTFREDLTLTTWFAKDAWLRVRFDAFVKNHDATAVVVDWKTGKLRQGDEEQCELFSLAVFLAYPEISTVTTELWYTATGSIPTPVTHHRSDLAMLKEKWFGLAARMLAETEFLPTPNGLCGWCHYRKSNGGPCRYA